MKKQTKKMIMAVLIMFVFAGSVVSFAALSFISPQQSNQFTPLTTNIVDGPLPPIEQQTYVQNGFTWITFYYASADKNFITFMQSLPESLTTTTGQPQIFLERINSTYENETYVMISSNLGYDNFVNQSETMVMDDLCKFLTVTPLECGLQNLIIAPQNPENATNATV
jgi:hypothetical protein